MWNLESGIDETLVMYILTWNILVTQVILGNTITKLFSILMSFMEEVFITKTCGNVKITLPHNWMMTGYENVKNHRYIYYKWNKIWHKGEDGIF